MCFVNKMVASLLNEFFWNFFSQSVTNITVSDFLAYRDATGYDPSLVQ